MDELDQLFERLKEEGQRTFDKTPRDVCIAHHAFRRGRLRLCYRIIDRQFSIYKDADANPGFLGVIAQIHSILQPIVSPQPV